MEVLRGEGEQGDEEKRFKDEKIIEVLKQLKRAQNHLERWMHSAMRSTAEPSQRGGTDAAVVSGRGAGLDQANMDAPINAQAWFYNQRACTENLIKEANNDAGLAAHPSTNQRARQAVPACPACRNM